MPFPPKANESIIVRRKFIRNETALVFLYNFSQKRRCIMQIRTIVIIGAGAIGAYVYHGLYPLTESGNIRCCFIAEGERRKRLETNGLIINEVQYHPEVCTPEEANGADLVLISVKYSALPSVLESVRTIADSHTVVLSLLNGIDSEEILAEVIPSSQIIYSLIRVSSQNLNGRITYNPASAFGIWAGECGEYDQKEALHALEQLFAGTDIPFHISEDIRKDQWHKFALNISANLPQAVLNVGTGAYEDSGHVGWLRDALASEVLKTAEAYGIHIEKVSYGNWKKNGRLSTLQDLDRKQKTEVDMFLGVLMDKAAEKGISVPYSEYTFHAVKALEEKNEGRFDY